VEELDFGVLLGLAYHQFVAELHERLAQEGFTHLRPAFGFAFKVLARESLTTSDLAARLGITPQGAAKIVEEMAAAGYVDRTADPSDKRIRRLALTDRCRSLLEVAHEFHAAYEQALAAELGADRVTALREVLDAIVDRADSPDSLARSVRQL
jgi:DNA-binding MarR family transcriptional regulator